MPLEILLILVALGIGGIVLLTHLMGYSETCPLPDETAVTRHWLRHFPEDTVSAVAIDDDGHTAIVMTQAGPGLLWSFGADTVARLLHDAEIEETPEGFLVRLHDFTAPRHLIRLAPDHHAAWRNRLLERAA